jgi:hypothetical protein
MNICKKVEKWLQNHPQEMLPEWIQEHLETCSSCQQIVEVSSQLQAFSQAPKKAIQYTFKPALDWRIRNSIYTTADTIKNSNKHQKKATSRFQKGFVAAFSAVCLLIAMFFTIPVANQNTTFSLLLNEKFKEMIQMPSSPFFEEVDTLASVDDHLQFVRYYCETKEEREFLYSNNEDSRNRLLFVKFIGMQSDIPYVQIYQYAQKDLYFQAIQKAKLPLWKTWNEFASYLDQFTLLPGQPFESFDATVLSVDYTTGAIQTDVFPKPLFADYIIMQQVKPFKTYRFTIKTKSSKNNNIVALDLPLENDSSLQGKIVSIHKNSMYLDGFSEELFVSEKVLDGEKASSRLQKNDYVFIRATQTTQNQWVITSLSVLQEPSPRKITGTVAEVYRNGFVLDKLEMSFFSFSLSQKLSQRDIVTLEGMDYGTFFMVEDVISHIPFQEEKEEYYLASHNHKDDEPESLTTTPPKKTTSSTPPSSPRNITPDVPTESDIVVGIQEDQYYFLSGKVVSKDQLSQPLSVGESIRYKKEQNSFTIQRHFMNQSQVVQFTVEYLEKLPNGVDIYHSPQDGSRIYVFRSSIEEKENVSMFQGKVVSYGGIHIALQWRIFSFSTLVDIQAVITKEIEHQSLYQLDNGCVLKIDDLTEVQGTIQIGKTVKISGQYDQNVLKGYIVRVEKEIFLLQGEIVDWNEEEKWLLLDTGVVIQLNEATIFHGQGVFKEGTVVYCKVYVKDGQYIASDVSWEENSIPGTGDRI